MANHASFMHIGGTRHCATGCHN